MDTALFFYLYLFLYGGNDRPLGERKIVIFFSNLFIFQRSPISRVTLCGSPLLHTQKLVPSSLDSFFPLLKVSCCVCSNSTLAILKCLQAKLFSFAIGIKDTIEKVQPAGVSVLDMPISSLFQYAK